MFQIRPKQRGTEFTSSEFVVIRQMMEGGGLFYLEAVNLTGRS